MAIEQQTQRASPARNSNRPFSGKVVVVTGAAMGIGLGCAERFARDGASVILADKDEPAGQTAASDLADHGHDAMYVHCDVAQRLDVLNLMAAALESHGRVDVLINNAGITEKGHFLDVDDATFDKITDVNLKGSFLVAQAVAKQMVAQLEAESGYEQTSPGTIINMTSINAIVARPERVVYGMTKAAIQSMTKGMALALAQYGIRVNAIAPGTISTPLTEALDEDKKARKRVLARTPLGRLGTADEIASVAAFLASDEASYVTGETIIVDGGRLPLHYMVETRE